MTTLVSRIRFTRKLHTLSIVIAAALIAFTTRRHRHELERQRAKANLSVRDNALVVENFSRVQRGRIIAIEQTIVDAEARQDKRISQAAAIAVAVGIELHKINDQTVVVNTK